MKTHDACSDAVAAGWPDLSVRWRKMTEVWAAEGGEKRFDCVHAACLPVEEGSGFMSSPFADGHEALADSLAVLQSTVTLQLIIYGPAQHVGCRILHSSPSSDCNTIAVSIQVPALQCSKKPHFPFPA